MPSRAKSAAGARFYRGIAAHGWRDSDYFTYSTSSPAFRRWIAAQLPARAKRVLSVGCGTGELECHLAAGRHRVVGLDLSQPMLERARSRGLDRVVQAESRHLPFAAGSFDLVLFPESIGHLELASAFREAARVLKPGGSVAATTYVGAIETHAAYAKFPPAEIAGALAAAGLGVVERRFLDAKRGAVTELPTEDGASVLYIRALKPAVRAR
jgi:SAM-dependent methyltransferase